MARYTTAMKERMGLDPEVWDIITHVFKSPTGNPSGARGAVVVRVTHLPSRRTLEDRSDGPFTKRQASVALGSMLQALLTRLGRTPPEPEGRRRRR